MVAGVANDPIPVILLPNLTGCSARFVNFFGAITFPGVEDFFQRVFWGELEEHVDVIRHHHEGLQEITVPIEMPERVRDDVGDGWLLKNAFTTPFIQPGVDGFRESFVVFSLGFRRPRFRMPRNPCITLLAPEVQLLFRKTVRETPGHENQFSLLLPVGEFEGSVLADFLGGFEIGGGRDAHAP